MRVPPRLATWLLCRLSPSARRSEVEGDLLEAFEGWDSKGDAYAWLRYWREVLLIVLWRPVAAWRRARDGRSPSILLGSSIGHRGADVLQPRIQDVRYGIRTLVRSPGFAVVAVLILGLGIGANATMYTVVNSLFVQSPPLIHHPDRLVGFTLTDEGGLNSYFAYPDYEFYRENNDVFSGVLAYNGGGSAVAVGLRDEIVQAEAWNVSYNFFDVLGVAPVEGRAFIREEGETPGEHAVVVVSHGFWTRHLGGDRAALDRTIQLNGRPFRVVGVVPQGFRGPSAVDPAPDLYLPLMMIGAISPGGEEWLRHIDGNISLSHQVVGRLRDGTDFETARAHMDVLQARWESAFAPWISTVFDRGDGQIEPYRVGIVPRFHLTPRQGERLARMLTPLFLAVGAVLLIACANIAILLLARASARQREMGIRAALGASRTRVVVQLLTESLLLAGIGGALGIAVALWAAGLAAGLIPMTFAGDFRPDLSVVGFTMALSAGAAVLFGLVPALQLSRSDIAAFLQRQGHGKSRTTLRNALVVAQLTISIVLVTGAGLFVRSLLNAQNVDLGFDKHNRLLLSVVPANHGYDEEQGREFVRVMLDQFQSMSGVRSATTTDRTPFRGRWTSGFTAPGTAYGEDRFRSGFNRVGPGYFRTFGIPIVAGRDFSDDDDEVGPNAVIVNEHVAQQVWPGESAVGKTILRGEREWTVVGVARNAVYYDIGEDTWAQTYHPYFQNYRTRVTFAVATEADPLAMVRQVEQVIRDFDPNIAIFSVRTLEDVVADELGQLRVMAILIVLFGLLALTLSAVGLYAVQSFLVARRTREIGIRMALGAVRRQVAGGVVSRGVLLASVGVVVGLVAAYASAQLIQGLLFDVPARDPATFGAVAIVLLVVAGLSSLLPALRASRVDPVEALREE